MKTGALAGDYHNEMRGITRSCEKEMAGTNIMSSSNSCMCNRMCALM